MVNNAAVVQFSCSVMFTSLQPHEPQHAMPPCPSPTPKRMSMELVMPSNDLILCLPLHLLPSIFPSIRVFSNDSVLRIEWPKYWSISFNNSPSNEYPGLFKSINSSALSFLYSPTLTSIHDHWKNHSPDWTDLCWQSNVSAF